MSITKQQLKQSLSHINSLIDDCLGDEACEQFIDLAKEIEDTENQTDIGVKADFYASFAFFLFTVSAYEESLNMFMKAQENGYSKQKIKEFIFEAFIEPNLIQFEEIYNKNMEFLISSGYLFSAVKFEELPFWLIPTMIENEYYVYDKHEQLIKEKISMIDQKGSISLSDKDEFADYLVLENWNWSKINLYLNAIRNRNKKCYIVINEIEKFLSCFQGKLLSRESISEILIFDGFEQMSEYFKRSSNYLPRNIIDLFYTNGEPQRIIDEIHSYRISKSGRNGDNVLISVCIPSFNRGHRAYENIIHCLKSNYDEEIEFIISNNGTKNETQQYYDDIASLEDSRLRYFAFSENQGVALNICKVCDMARGKFNLLLSDEDKVDFGKIHIVMKTLLEMKDTLAILKTKGDVQAIPSSTKLEKAGREALVTYMLTSNYLSGIIFNNNLIKKHNATQYIKNNLENAAYFYYPHMFLELFLCQYGNVKGTDTILINEGKAEITEVTKTDIGSDNKISISYYASVEGRLEQHSGFLSIFRELEICKNNFSIFREMYIILCAKTLYLVTLSINMFYSKIEKDLFALLNTAFKYCKKCLEEIHTESKGTDLNDYEKDLMLLDEYYEYFKVIVKKTNCK